MAINFSDLVGGGGGVGVVPAETAVDSSSFVLPFVKTETLTAVDGTVGQTITINSKLVLIGLSIQGATVNDTKYSLTIDGKVRARFLDSFGGAAGNNIIYDAALFRTTATASALNSAGIAAPIIANSSLSFFVQTATDTSINISVIYAPIE